MVNYMKIAELIYESLEQSDEIPSQMLNEQLRGKFAEWLASKIPGTSAAQMRKAVDIVSLDGDMDGCDEDEIARDLLGVIYDELLIAFEPEMDRMFKRVINSVASNYR
jgi:hypothetical protein